jgi:glucosamine-6-phosphate deaminase
VTTETTFTVESLRVQVFDDDHALGRTAAEDAAEAVRAAVDANGVANVMFASGNSQFSFLDELLARHHIDWGAIVAFHMDEYAGVAPEHPASFQRYMRERITARVPVRAFHYLHGDATDATAEAKRYAALLHEHPLDLCCLGIGENGHLAFNDPPVADFDDPLDVKVVELDAACRAQQVGEGHFPSIDAVPTHAITVTIPALLRARRVLAIVPEARKATPVAAALEGPISTACPASILRRQSHATLYLDRESASLLSKR